MTLPAEVADLVQEAAEASGLPVDTLISRGAQREARSILGKAALDEQLAEMGPISAEAEAWANEVMTRHLQRTAARRKHSAS